MKSKRQTATITPVLRNVVLQAQPHALLRPGARHVAGRVLSAVADLNGSAGLPPAPLAQAHGASYQSALAEARKEGYATGHAAAVQEEHAKLQAFVNDECQRVLEQARREGLEQGLAEAAAQSQKAAEQAAALARDALDTQVRRLVHLLQEVPAQVHGRLTAAEDDMVALCHEIVCRILGDTLVTPEGILAVLRQLLSQLPAKGSVAVHLHPDDFALLANATTDAIRQGQELQWVVDDQVGLGGMLLRSPQGSLDARLDIQLQALQSVLLNVRNARQTPKAESADTQP